MIGGESLAVFPELGMAVGVHSEVRDGLEGNSSSGIVSFATRVDEADTTLGGDGENVRVFSDGVIIKLESKV